MYGKDRNCPRRTCCEGKRQNHRNGQSKGPFLFCRSSIKAKMWGCQAKNSDIPGKTLFSHERGEKILTITEKETYAMRKSDADVNTRNISIAFICAIPGKEENRFPLSQNIKNGQEAVDRFPVFLLNSFVNREGALHNADVSVSGERKRRFYLLEKDLCKRGKNVCFLFGRAGLIRAHRSLLPDHDRFR